VNRTRAIVLLLVATLSTTAAGATVAAGDYDAFWLWGGVAPQPILQRARTVYVLQGQIGGSPREDAAVVLTAQGISVPRLVGPDVWLVYRARTLRWEPSVYATMLARLDRWRRAGNAVVGIQIDFDTRAAYLGEYAAFLRDLRARLPRDCRLGITGLLDWSSNADPERLNELAQIVDELVVQTYQGRRTIADYPRYLPRLARLTVPFKIGLIQDGEWEAPESLSAQPAFRGYVVFLQNR
jgi:hypothetical protein